MMAEIGGKKIGREGAAFGPRHGGRQAGTGHHQKGSDWPEEGASRGQGRSGANLC